ncbi:MAG: 3'-5' exonuclease [Cytophagaceae bacterium]|jgi:DNA polymerase-3 subunit epsilon|nr:3'-5' exonuclease [Cytophagaceae bacterium]
MALQLHKPLVFFDIEATGMNISSDKIVEIGLVKVMPNQEVIRKSFLINPGIPIPEEIVKIHGITNEQVAEAPTFDKIAHTLNQFLQGCDLGGYNPMKLDIPLLMEEFNRVNIQFDLSNRRIVDAQKIFHLMEPRTLSAAYKFYCQKEMENAHRAEADAFATYEVLMAQLERYDGKSIKDHSGKESVPVKNDIQALHQLCVGNMVDIAGRMILNDKSVIIFNFGKYKGQAVQDVFKKDPAYYDWMMNGDFAIDTKRKLTEIKLAQLKK